MEWERSNFWIFGTWTNLRLDVDASPINIKINPISIQLNLINIEMNPINIELNLISIHLNSIIICVLQISYISSSINLVTN
jgi:hypothetical protein